MDSLTQIALGSAVGVAVMGRRTPAWKAALAGAFFGTLPDLDALIKHADPIRNMTFHRAESHGFFYLTLLSPLLAWLVLRLWPNSGSYRRWLLAIWLILITHVLLDALTVYGTQLLQPFSDHPFEVGSIFIIDPLYTLPLLLGLLLTLRRKADNSRRWNNLALGFSSAYLLWGIGAQYHVKQVAEETLAQQYPQVEQILVTATPFNTWVWRVLAMTPDGYLEGFYALNDSDKAIKFDFFPFADASLQAAAKQIAPHQSAAPLPVSEWEIARMAWFSHGFFHLREEDGRLIISDLRMGQEPFYTFNFVVAERDADQQWQAIKPELDTVRPPIRATLSWLKQRATGQRIAPPRVAHSYHIE